MWAETHGIRVSEARESNDARSDYQAARDAGTIEQQLADFEASAPAASAPTLTRAASVTRKASARPLTAAPPAPANNLAAKKAASDARISALRAKMAAKKAGAGSEAAAAPAPAKGVRLNLGNAGIARPANTPFNAFAEAAPAPAAAAGAQRNLNNV
jgi:hypothetical protein